LRKFKDKDKDNNNNNNNNTQIYIQAPRFHTTRDSSVLPDRGNNCNFFDTRVVHVN